MYKTCDLLKPTAWSVELDGTEMDNINEIL